MQRGIRMRMGAEFAALSRLGSRPPQPCRTPLMITSLRLLMIPMLIPATMICTQEIQSRIWLMNVSMNSKPIK